MVFAQRKNRFRTELTFEALANARSPEVQGRHIVHLEIGQLELVWQTRERAPSPLLR